jgi:hypothetical protein
MNERIRDLAEQAGINSVVPVKGKGSLEYVGKGEVESLKKFSELIIQESMFVGSQWANGLLDEKHYVFVNKKIKQHFGVEDE